MWFKNRGKTEPGAAYVLLDGRTTDFRGYVLTNLRDGWAKIREHDKQILERAEAGLAILELVGILIKRVNDLTERVASLTVRKPAGKKKSAPKEKK